MRLWHIDLIPYLPRQQLLGQWRELHAIIGTINKHGKVNHSTVNYVNDHPIYYLTAYAKTVHAVMKKRGYKSDWVSLLGKIDTYYLHNGNVEYLSTDWADVYRRYMDGTLIYPEHNEAYLQECLDNLRSKGIEIEMAEEENACLDYLENLGNEKREALEDHMQDVEAYSEEVI